MDRVVFQMDRVVDRVVDHDDPLDLAPLNRELLSE
jgi:hypothetical protein